MRFLFVDVIRGKNPTIRLAFGGCLQTLALCSVSILAVTLCRFAIYLKTALCRAAPLTSHFVRQRPFDIANESVSRGIEPNRRLAFGGCLQTLAFFRATHYLSLRAKKRGPQKILLYFWGKGVCKHKTGNCRLRRLTGQKRSIRRVAISRKGHRIIKPTQDTFVIAWRKKAHTSIRVSIVAPTMRFQKCSVRREQPR